MLTQFQSLRIVLITNAIALALFQMSASSQTLSVTNDLSLWLAANFGVTTNAGNLISQWDDQSGAGHSASQYTGTNQPVLLSDQLNGLPVTHFTDYQFLSVAGRIISSQTFTIVAVVRDLRVANDQDYREIISNWAYPRPVLQSIFLGTTSSNMENNPEEVRFTDNFGGSDQGVPEGIGAVTNPSDFFILTAVSGANTVAVYQNRTRIAFRPSPLTSRCLDAGYVVGRQGTSAYPTNGTSSNVGPFDEYWHGDIAEILVFNHELSGNELAQVWQFEQIKYFPTQAQLELTIAQADTSIQLTFAAPLSKNYYLQAEDRLNPGLWTTIATVAGPITASNIVIWDAVTNSQRYYRLQRDP